MSVTSSSIPINDHDFEFLQAGCIMSLAHHNDISSSQSIDTSIPNEIFGGPVVILAIQGSDRMLKSRVVFAPIASFKDNSTGTSTSTQLDDDYMEIVDTEEAEDDTTSDFFARVEEHFRKLSEGTVERKVLHLRNGQKMEGSSLVRLKVYRTTASRLCKLSAVTPSPRLTANSLWNLRSKIVEKSGTIDQESGEKISLESWARPRAQGMDEWVEELVEQSSSMFYMSDMVWELVQRTAMSSEMAWM